MTRREQLKVLGVFLGVLLFITLFWLGIRYIENNGMSEAADDGFQSATDEIFDNPDDTFDHEAAGKVKIGGKKYKYYHEIETYLFLGTDASGNESGEGEDYQGALADFLLLLVIDKTDHTYAFLQPNRDTMTEVTLLLKDGTGSATSTEQLCIAHWYGGSREQGAENTKNALSHLLGGLSIDGYYELNMKEIPALNHLVGGVEVMIEDDFSKVDPSLRQGETILLSDEQAFTFIHDRFDVGDEENLSRMKRQRAYMTAFFKKLQKKNSEDPAYALETYQQLQELAVTDISGKVFSRIAKEISEGTSRGFFDLEGTAKIGDTLGDGVEHVEYYVEDETILQVLTELYQLEPAKKK